MNTNRQILNLSRSGLTAEEIAESLELDPASVSLALRGSTSNRQVTAEELIEKFRPECIQILYDIASDSSIENVSARVMSAKIIVEGKGLLPAFEVGRLNDRLAKMKRVIELHQNKLPIVDDKKEECLLLEA